MKRFSMLARHVTGLVALAVALLTFGSASLVASTVAAPSGGTERVVAANDQGRMTSKVFATVEDGHTMRAKFTPSQFHATDDGMSVTGTLKGVITGKGAFEKTVTLPVQSVNGVPVDGDAGDLRLASNHGCDVLNLVLGPLDLNILGLQVDLSQVVLDIVAQPGPGNLLGNLLCAVAGLLDGGLSGLLGQLGDLLNQILGALNLGL